MPLDHELQNREIHHEAQNHIPNHFKTGYTLLCGLSNYLLTISSPLSVNSEANFSELPEKYHRCC